MSSTEIKLLTRKTVLKVSNFLLAQTHAILKNFNFFHDFVQIVEITIIRKIFPKYMDSVTSRRWEKIS